MAKIKIQKKKLSECCGAPMIGGVQCENCGSNGKFNSNTAIVRKLEEIIEIVKPNHLIALVGAGVHFKDMGNGVVERRENGKVELGRIENGKWVKGERFIEEDGFIKDTKTKLMWDKNGSQERLTYAQAEEFVAELNKEQYPDWRIPTREELLTLVDDTKHDPAIDPIFKCESAGYWTSTPYANYPDNIAGVVGFSNGYVYGFSRGSSGYVRPVRQYF
jgi:hypothetical protein